MTLTEQVINQARLMAQELTEENEALLEAICRAAVTSLQYRLRPPLTPEDCGEDFVMAAGLYAIAAMSGVTDLGQLEQVTAGDVTLRRGSMDAAANCLRSQAEMLMMPYLKTPFLFLGV